MLVIAKQDITIFRIVEVEDTTRYYTLTKEWPDKPTTNPPSSEWMDTEPETTFEQSASGTSLKLTDVSSITHTMDVKVKRKNLVPYPYANGTKTVNGVTFTDNGDGTITVNGTATAQTVYYVVDWTGLTLDVNTDIVFSGCPTGGSGSTYRFDLVMLYPDGNYRYSSDMGNSFHLKPSSDGAKIAAAYICVEAGCTANNLVFKPQIELGSAATDYTPYVEDLSSVGIKKYGKNVIPYPYYEGTRTKNGVTFTDNGDGTITVNGTATRETEFYLSFGNVDFSIGSTYISSSGMDRDPDDRYGLSLQAGEGNYYKDSETFEAKADKDIYVTIFIRKGYTADNMIFKPQLEIGTVATEYEPYKQTETYTPLEDDTVEGVTSLYPTTTLISDTSGVIIDAEYSKDTSENLYFTDLTTYTDDTYKYSEVSKSSDYEAAKEAFNKALISENTAQDAKDATDDLNANLTKTITEQYSALTTNIDSISGSVTKLETTVEETNASTQKTIAELQEQVNMSITSDEVNIAIEKKLQNGVTKVDTKTGFTFDENGLNVNKTGSETNTQITEDGMYVRNTETNKVVLTANKDGVEARDLKATTYLIVGGRSRFENYKTDRTGCFWIGG